MPGWLQVASSVNPLTYVVDAVRSLMLASWTSTFGLGLDFGVLIVATGILVLIASRLYPGLAT
jgi:ABC-2 type transport system permease protein